MRVQATKEGFYNQHICVVGEVFDLIDNDDGSPPLKMERTYEMGKDGKPTGEYTEEVWMDREGNVRHRDYAPDSEEIKGKGAFRGESYNLGWMVQVPDETPLGIYEPDVRFDMSGSRAPVPIQRVIKPSNEPANMPRVTPMKGQVNRQRRASPA